MRPFRPRLLTVVLPGILLGAAGGVHLEAQSPSRYHNHAALTSAIDSVRRLAPRLVEVTALGDTPGRRTVWALRLGAGADVAERPALLVIANAHGPEVVGSEVALGVARRLAQAYGRDSVATRLLDERTIYLIPRANPDAAEGMFARPAVERTANDLPTDDDRDGSLDEDGPEDLDGNGLITLMRVRDSAGAWLPDSAEPFLLRQADRSKGERGLYRVYPEGRDNDGDEDWNEDPAGGVNVGSNLSYGYEFFAPGSGLNMIGTPESRALAQFFVDHPNVAAVYVLGPQDNLLTAWTHKKESGGDNRPLTTVAEEDEPWFTEIARRYRVLTGRDKGPAGADLKGDPLSFSYYHMGRWAWGSPAWLVPDVPADSGAENRKADKADGKDPLARERRALRWLRSCCPDAIVEWTRIDHPDFPGRVVEIGGFRPYALTNPPDSLLDPLVTQHAGFIQELAGALPDIRLRDVEVEQVGAGVYRVRVEVSNEGFLPTTSRLGVRVRWPRRVRIELKTDGQQLASGRAVQLIDPLPGSGASTELTWVVVGERGSRVTLTATSPVAGTATRTITLR